MNTARDPAFLDPGQAAQIVNGIYRQGDPSLWRIPGYSLYDRPASASVSGMAVAQFRGGTRYLLAQMNSKLYHGGIDILDTMVSASASNGSTLVATQMGNRFYVLNGVDSPICLLPDGTVRPTGLQPVNGNLPTPTTAAGTFNGEAGGFYDYWITEVYKSTATAEMGSADAPFELESAFSAKPATVSVPASLAAKVGIVLPTEKVNSLATHWRIYRGGPKTDANDTTFPIGYQVIDDIAISTASYGTTVYDGSNSNTGDQAAAALTASNWVASAGAASTGAISATGGDYLTITATGQLTAELTLGSFPFTNLADPINGIEVTIVASKASGSRGEVSVDISLDGGTTWSPTRNRFSTLAGSSAGTATATFGGSADKWGFPEITQSQAATSSFRVRIKQVYSSLSNTPLKLDKVACKLYYNGAISPDRLYNAVVVEAGDSVGAVSGAGLPPVASIGCTFGGMLVFNDVSKPTMLRYSQADSPEYWPSLYYINIETEDNQALTFVGTVNNRLVVGHAGGIVRVNYLPVETDSTFQRGVVWEYVSRAHGVVNARAATIFTGRDGRQLMAFISHNGLYATDGYSVTSLSDNLAWFDSVIGQGNPTTFFSDLVSDPSTHTLWLYTTGGQAWIYHYLTGVWTGPCYVAPVSTNIGGAVCLRGVTGKPQHYIGCAGAATNRGKIYVSDTSDYYYALAAGTPGSWPLLNSNFPNLRIRTRDIHAAGLGNEFRVGALSVYATDEQSAISRSQPLTMSIAADLFYANDAAVTGQAIDDVTPEGKETLYPIGDIAAAGVAFVFTCEEAGAGPARFHSFQLYGADGKEVTVA